MREDKIEKLSDPEIGTRTVGPKEAAQMIKQTDNMIRALLDDINKMREELRVIPDNSPESRDLQEIIGDAESNLRDYQRLRDDFNKYGGNIKII